MTMIDDATEPVQVRSTRYQTRTGSSIIVTGYGYQVQRGKGETTYLVDITNFEFDLKSVIVMDDARLFEVEVNGASHQLPSNLFSSTRDFTKWCNARGLEWNGLPADLVGVYSLLNQPMEPVPQKMGVRATGLHGRTWVFTDWAFGDDPDGVVYVPPVAEVNPHYNIARNPKTAFDPRAIQLLATLHRPDVMTPILGWFAIAPLCSLMPNFPALNISGASGNGKTTIIKANMDAFGYWDHRHSTTFDLLPGGALTPHGVRGLVASTVSFPVWFDELRGSTPYELRQVMSGVVQAVWNKSGGPRGGMSENLSRIENMKVTVPVIISGEDDFNQKAQVDRIVWIEMPSRGKSESVLNEMYARNGGEFDYQFGPGMGRAYLAWLLENVIGHMTMPGQGSEQRPERAIEMVEWGYGMLQAFCLDHDDEIELPEFDASLLRKIKGDKVDLLLLAIHDADSTRDRDGKPIVWHEGDETCVRAGALVKWTETNWPDGQRLPGGSQAVSAELKDRHGAEQVWNNPVPYEPYDDGPNLNWKGRYLVFTTPESLRL